MVAFFSRFKKRWSATGVVASPTDAQSDVGFGYLGANPPTVELFNAIFQGLDEKDNWLYTRIEEVLLAAGVTPAEATSNQLLTALRGLFAPGMWIGLAGAPQSFIVPAGVTRVKARLWGGGGGGGGASGAGGAGTGGAGGGYCEGVFSVTPGASIFVTVGSGGLGGPPSNGLGAQFGGTTSLGSLASASGGAGGLGSVGLGIVTGVVPPGGGAGGYLNLSGQLGGFGQIYVGGGTGGGIGGASPFGGGNSHLSIGGTGNNGIFPGGGACGGATSSSVANSSGGRGADGLCILEW